MKLDIPITMSALARRIGVEPQAISKWERVPPARVIAVCEAVDWAVTPHQLRSDIYPNPTDGLPQEPANA